MARELPTYRLWLEQIQTTAKGKLILNQGDVQAITGKGYRWCKSHLDVGKDGISTVQLALSLARFDNQSGK